MIKELAVGATLALIMTLSACAPGGGTPEPLTSFGDGTWKAGKQVKAGTWETRNPGPHTRTVQCSWTLSLGSNEGTVTLRSNDPQEKPQRVYIPAGQILRTSNCGVWEWISKENLT